MKKISGVLLILLTAAFALPLAALIYLSFRSGDGFGLEQYRRALSDAEFLRRLSCSCRITLLSLAFHLPVALICGLLLARGRFRGRTGLSMLFVLALLLPFQVIMLPVYKMSLASGLYDSYWSVVLLAAFAPLGTLISVVLIRGVPESQWEAASLETNSLFETMRLVILPQILPGLAVLGLLVFADTWNMVEQPLVSFAHSGKAAPIPGLQRHSENQHGLSLRRFRAVRAAHCGGVFSAVWLQRPAKNPLMKNSPKLLCELRGVFQPMVFFNSSVQARLTGLVVGKCTSSARLTYSRALSSLPRSWAMAAMPASAGE